MSAVPARASDQPSVGSLLAAVDPRVRQARILVVDDQPANVKLLESLLGTAEFVNVVSTTKSEAAVDLVGEFDPDIVLLDLRMPGLDGFEVMARLAPWIRGQDALPVLVLTADTTFETKRRALAAGAKDFLTKPFDPVEVILRIRNLLETRFLQMELRGRNADLEQRVRARTRELEEARIEVVERLALAAEFKDDATGQHAQRVGRTAALLARELGLGGEFVELIRRAAPLHDIGKIGISDDILRKRGSLTPDELDVMRFHVSIGGDLLAGSRARVLQLGEEIALTHHERWDGSGYLAGARAENIPLAGRIVAVADVFDALTSRRPYRDPDPPAVAGREIQRLRGSHFDPEVVDAFVELDHDLLVVSTAEFDVGR